MSDNEQEVEIPDLGEGRQDEAPQGDPQAEAEARKYGWKPKDEFTLNPEGWVPAERFLELPSTQRKVVQDTNQRLERELKARDEEMSRIAATTAEAIERVRKQERDRYEAQIAAFEAAKREAVDVGDVARYDALTKQEKALRPPDATPAPPATPQIDPAFTAYLEASVWTKDPSAYQFAAMAIEDHPEIKRLPPLKQVQWAEKKVREFFPEHFPEPTAKPQFSKVDGGGLGQIGKRGKGPDDLPAEARKVGQEFVTDGIFKSLDEYAASYFAQEKRA